MLGHNGLIKMESSMEQQGCRAVWITYITISIILYNVFGSLLLGFGISWLVYIMTKRGIGNKALTNLMMTLMFDVYTFIGGWRAILKDISELCIMSGSQTMYDYIINDTYQNTCWILDQDYNIWQMLINRHTAFAVVSFGTSPSVLETVQKQN